MNEYEFAVEVRNTTTSPLKLVLEPWGNEYDLAQNQTARISFAGPRLYTIPIDHQGNCIMIEGVEGLRSLGVWIDEELVG
jgi:hypothetical protein